MVSSLPRRQRYGSSWPSDVLLRGRADGVRALSADQEAQPRVPGCGSLAHPEEARRSRENEPTRCNKPRQAVARRRADSRVGAGRAARGHARPLARPSGSERDLQGKHELADAAEARSSRAADCVEELLDAVRQDSERVERLEQAMEGGGRAEVVRALQAMRGIDLTAAVTILAEIGDLSRFRKSARADGLFGSGPLTRAPQVTRLSAAASPRPVMAGRDAFLWRRPGATGILLA